MSRRELAFLTNWPLHVMAEAPHMQLLATALILLSTLLHAVNGVNIHFGREHITTLVSYGAPLPRSLSRNLTRAQPNSRYHSAGSMSNGLRMRNASAVRSAGNCAGTRR